MVRTAVKVLSGVASEDHERDPGERDDKSYTGWQKIPRLSENKETENAANRKNDTTDLPGHFL